MMISVTSARLQRNAVPRDVSLRTFLSTVALIAVSSVARGQSGTIRQVYTYDRVIAGHRIRISGTDNGCVNISSSNVTLGISAGAESHQAWAWAYSADSVSRLPAHRHANEEIDFAPISTGSGDRVHYERVVDGDTSTEHRLWFETSYGYRFGVWLSGSQLYDVVNATIRAAKTADSITAKTATVFCY